jgi:hypothetical protein
VVKGGGDVNLGGGLVVEGTLVVEAGTRIHTEGPVVLEPTMQLELVLLNPETLEDGSVEIIACTTLPSRCLVCKYVLCSVYFAIWYASCLYLHNCTGAEAVRAADAGVSGTAPKVVRLRKEYADECDAEVKARAEVTQQGLSVTLSSDGC